MALNYLPDTCLLHFLILFYVFEYKVYNNTMHNCEIVPNRCDIVLIVNSRNNIGNSKRHAQQALPAYTRGIG